MNYTGSMILFIFLVQLAAYTLKWLIGFGNPLISAPLLAMRLDNTLITPGSLLPDLVINGRITWQSRNNFRWRAILPLLLAMVAGVVPGTWLLRFSLPWIIKTVLGGVVVFLGLEMATRRLRPIRPDRREIPWLRYLVAFFSGMCAGLFGINMFLVAYLQRTAKDYDEFKGSICFLFLGENLFRTGLYLCTGLLNRSSLCFSLISLAAAFCAARLARHPQVLCVVNRRKTAQQLYAALPAEGSYCLTTLLCAADRRRQLDGIRQRLKEGLPCRVVSTSLIEAGVDVDFPVAYREQCGLDSLLQTAGRCNRAEESIVYRFRLDECSTPQMLRQNVSALDYTARHQDTLDTPRAIQLYFNELSDLRGPDAVDKHGILDAFLRGIRGCQFPFAQVAEEFRLIENAARTVYLPVGEGAALCEQLRSGHVTRTLLRKLGIYSVSCYKDQFDKLDAAGALELRPDGSAILTDTSCYSEKTGLAMDVETGIGLYF